MHELNPTALALAALPDGVVLFDRQQRVSFANRAAAELLAVDVERLLGAHWEEMHAAYMLPDAGTRERSLLEREGRRFYVQPIALPPEAARAGVSYGLLFTRASDEVARIRDLLGTVSHDTRAPLTVIRGFSELLLRGMVGQLGEDQREIVTGIHARSGDVIHLVNQTIALLDILTWVPELTCDEVEVVALARQVAERCESWHRARAIRCEVSCADDALLARSLDMPLRRALWQLIENACRATPDGGVVTIGVRRDGERVYVEIHDAGPGIPEMFGQGAVDVAEWRGAYAYSAAWRGPCLGLAIVRACLKHGGLGATLSSAAGAGSTFVLSAPAAG